MHSEGCLRYFQSRGKKVVEVPDKNLRLIILRHGETEANSQRIIQGHLDNRLSERGREQADKVAARLRDESIDLIYSSDLLRAQETAAAVAESCGLRVRLDPALRERSYGEFEGRPVAEYEAAFKSSNLLRENFRPANGENLLDFEKRITAFLRAFVEEHLGRTVLIVAHAGTNRMLLKILLKKRFSDWLDLQQENTCVNILELSSVSDAHARLLNCVSHLGASEKLKMGVYE